MYTKVSADEINRIYDKLIELCGARESLRGNFVQAWESYDPLSWPYEYRFQGSLGFGGKLYWSATRGFRVGCYSEDYTRERREAIETMNTWLDKNYPEGT